MFCSEVKELESQLSRAELEVDLSEMESMNKENLASLAGEHGTHQLSGLEMIHQA
jgi:hypothetical protein